MYEVMELQSIFSETKYVPILKYVTSSSYRNLGEFLTRCKFRLHQLKPKPWKNPPISTVNHDLFSIHIPKRFPYLLFNFLLLFIVLCQFSLFLEEYSFHQDQPLTYQFQTIFSSLQV